MILVDSNVLIALADQHERLHQTAVADLKRLVGHEMLLASPVITEVCAVLPAAHHRARVRQLMQDLSIRPLVFADEQRVWTDVFAWLARYAEHEPDWADGYLAVASGRDRRFRVWSYDQEFRTIWRRPNGTRIPLARTT